MSDNITFIDWAIFIGTFISAVASLFLLIAQDKKSTRLGLIIFFGVLIGAIGSFSLLQMQEKESVQYERDLRLKAEEIARLNKQIFNEIIGGDSYCWLNIVIGSGLSGITINDPLITLEHNGEYPVYDVSVDWVDYDIIKERLKKTNLILTMEDARLGRTHFNIGNVSPHTVYQFLMQLHLPSDKNEASYFASITARNGSYLQDIKLARVNGKWKLATRLCKYRSGNLSFPPIFEYIDVLFPRDNKGEVKWN